MNASNKVAILGNGNFRVSNGQLQLVGGAESQLGKLADELGKRGVHVVIVFPGKEEKQLDCKNYRVHSLPCNWATLSGARSLLNVLRMIRPNVIIFRAATPIAPVYATIGIIIRAKLFYFAAHDWELTPRKGRLDKWRWQLFRFGLQLCSKVFAQNDLQKNGFRDLLWFNKNRVSGIKNLPLLEAVSTQSKPGKLFTWIGTYRPHKRPEWVIEIAKLSPEYYFHIVLFCWNDPKLEDEFAQSVKGVENVSFTPGVPRGELQETYMRSAAILITSESEGFPNVAIEAWSQGRAVISTPSNVLKELSEKHGVLLASSIDEFVEKIRSRSLDNFERIGQNGLKHFQKNYSTEQIIDQLLPHF